MSKRGSDRLDAPSFRDNGIVADQRPADDVDASVMASFPASDPPGSYHSQSGYPAAVGRP
jgi:hypothetical protein